MMKFKTTRSLLGLGLFISTLVAAWAMAQSFGQPSLPKNCLSIGETWANFNCPYDEEQKRCVGLEIAYEASSQCSVGTRPDGQSYFPPFHPAWGALESFFDAGFEDVHTVNDCFALCDVARPADSGISRHCCEKICSHAYDVQVNNIGSCPN
jgi:hypothetical protein